MCGVVLSVVLAVVGDGWEKIDIPLINLPGQIRVGYSETYSESYCWCNEGKNMRVMAYRR